MPGQLTCRNCGHSWWSNAGSARTRCGACRSVVYVSAHVRSGANSAHEEAWNADGNEHPYSGATVLVVIGFFVIIVIAGVIWLRRKNHLAPAAETPSETDSELTMGAMTRWSCGHEATLMSLAAGATGATAPCPFCGHPGIAGRYVDGEYREVRS